MYYKTTEKEATAAAAAAAGASKGNSLIGKSRLINFPGSATLGRRCQVVVFVRGGGSSMAAVAWRPRLSDREKEGE